MFLHYLAKLQRIIGSLRVHFGILRDDRHYAHDLCFVKIGNLCYVGVNVVNQQGLQQTKLKVVLLKRVH